MNVACGTDIIEISRIKKTIEHIGEKFLQEIYTTSEIEYCESKKNAKYQHYAARFAAKEAVYKAINSIIENKYSITWKNIEIINDINGKPKVHFNKVFFSQIQSIDISLSHCREYAVANVVILY